MRTPISSFQGWHWFSGGIHTFFLYFFLDYYYYYYFGGRGDLGVFLIFISSQQCFKTII